MQNPPGGPPDFTPPVLLATQPDSGAVLPDFDGRAEFQFDEVISEQSGNGLENLIRLSPRPEEVRVSWHRSRITVAPKGGWRPGTVYHLTLLPGIMDLSNNRLDERVTLIFSTGGPIPATTLAGTVIDWPAGRAGARALVEAVLLPDSLVYVTQADSAGDFTLSAVPPGTYRVFATVDANANATRDRREPYDSVELQLDSTATGTFWAFPHDTTGPQLRETALLDSVTVRIRFNQMLNPYGADTTTIRVRLLPDSLPFPHDVVWTPTVYDSVAALERETARVADSIAAAAADTLPADSAAAPDSVAPRDTVPRQPAPPDLAGAVDADTTAADTTRIARLLALRPALFDELILRFPAPLAPGTRYVIEARATNVNGAVAESRTLLIVPEAPDEPAAPARD